MHYSRLAAGRPFTSHGGATETVVFAVDLSLGFRQVVLSVYDSDRVRQIGVPDHPPVLSQYDTIPPSSKCFTAYIGGKG